MAVNHHESSTAALAAKFVVSLLDDLNSVGRSIAETLAKSLDGSIDSGSGDGSGCDLKPERGIVVPLLTKEQRMKALRMNQIREGSGLALIRWTDMHIRTMKRLWHLLGMQ